MDNSLLAVRGINHKYIVVGEDTNPNDDKNIFATLQFTANEVLRIILPKSQNNLCIVHPIAVYYGS